MVNIYLKRLQNSLFIIFLIMISSLLLNCTMPPPLVFIPSVYEYQFRSARNLDKLRPTDIKLAESIESLEIFLSTVKEMIESNDIDMILKCYSKKFTSNKIILQKAIEFYQEKIFLENPQIRFFYVNKELYQPQFEKPWLILENIIFFSVPNPKFHFWGGIDSAIDKVILSLVTLKPPTKSIHVFYQILTLKRNRGSVWQIESMQFLDRIETIIETMLKDREPYFKDNAKFLKKVSKRINKYEPRLSERFMNTQITSTILQNKDYYIRQGNQYFQNRDFQNALESYIKASQIDINDGELHQKISQVCILQKQYDRAIIALWRALFISPESGELHYSLARAYMKKRWYDFAQQELQKALQIDPNNYQAKVMQGVIFWYLNFNDIAIELLHKVVEAYPEKDEGYYMLANVYESMGDLDSARNFAKRALEICPNKIEYQYLYNNLPNVPKK